MPMSHAAKGEHITAASVKMICGKADRLDMWESSSCVCIHPEMTA